jgi:hypothetical protein
MTHHGGLGGMDHDERGMLHDLILTFVQKCNALQRLNDDLTRKLDAAEARLRLLEATHYGLI